MEDSEYLTDQVFRPFKRKKFLRKRTDVTYDLDEAQESAASPPFNVSSHLRDELHSSQLHRLAVNKSTAGDAGTSIQDVLRQRKALLRRRGGIEFGKETSQPLDAVKIGNLSHEEQEGDPDAAEIDRLVSRFAPQTGHVAEANDKHMYGLPFSFTHSIENQWSGD